jgi:diguanylate cyclase (GGDEF)-like protein/PAS domain S-box-containing protein
MWTESPIVRGLLDKLTDGVFFVDLKGKITFWNLAAEKITGITADDAVGRPCLSVLRHVDEEGRDLCRADCYLACSSSELPEWKAEAHLLDLAGRRVPVTLSISPLTDDAGSDIGRVETFTDRSPQVAAVERLRELEEIVNTDALTGIGNRRATRQIIERKLDEQTRYDWPFGILFLDLDDFKRINDRHGHEAGDRILCSTARALGVGLRTSDFVGRWGGEEFVIIVSDVDREKLQQTAERFRALTEENAIDFEARKLGVTASIGAATARNSDSVELLIDRADRLMYTSKFGGKNRVTMDDWSPVRGSDKQAV